MSPLPLGEGRGEGSGRSRAPVHHNPRARPWPAVCIAPREDPSVCGPCATPGPPPGRRQMSTAVPTAVPIVVQKYGGSSVADVEKIRKVARAGEGHARRGLPGGGGGLAPWATPPTSCWRWPSRCRRIRRGASWTCCSPAASASPWRCCRWRCTSWACRRSASPAARAASSPTTRTRRRASWRCGRTASRTSWRRARWSSSRATRASPTSGRSRRWGAAARTPRRWRWRRRWARRLRDLLRRGRRLLRGPAGGRRTRGSWTELTYDEMQELASAGAKVLNAQAVEFAKAKGIVILAQHGARAGHGHGGAGARGRRRTRG